MGMAVSLSDCNNKLHRPLLSFSKLLHWTLDRMSTIDPFQDTPLYVRVWELTTPIPKDLEYNRGNEQERRLVEAGIVYTVNGQSFTGKTKMARIEKRRGYGGPVVGWVLWWALVRVPTITTSYFSAVRLTLHRFPDSEGVEHLGSNVYNVMFGVPVLHFEDREL